MLALEKVAVVGLGVIGGSIAKALRKKGFAGEIIGVDQNENNHSLAKGEGVIANMNNTYDALRDADIVFVATPLGAYKSVFKEMKPFLKEGCIITDVGSVKASVHDIFNDIFDDSYTFIGGHPMAGSEKSGYEYAQGHMFENAYYFLTFDRDVEDSVIDSVVQLVGLMDAKAKVLGAKEHDRLVSKTSHMPHITAALLVDLLNEENGNLLDFVGGGFRDTTRIASGMPGLWRDILMFNREAIMDAMTKHMDRLSTFKDMLESENEEGIFELLNASRKMREQIPKHLSGAIEKELCIYLDVEDKPGIIADAAKILADAKINIKDIEIVHARENIPGVLKIGFYEEADYIKAMTIFNVA